MKIHSSQGDITDISTKKEALVVACLMFCQVGSLASMLHCNNVKPRIAKPAAVKAWKPLYLFFFLQALVPLFASSRRVSTQEKWYPRPKQRCWFSRCIGQVKPKNTFFGYEHTKNSLCNLKKNQWPKTQPYWADTMDMLTQPGPKEWNTEVCISTKTSCARIMHWRISLTCCIPLSW